jgi:hypothetical protein
MRASPLEKLSSDPLTLHFGWRHLLDELSNLFSKPAVTFLQQ